MRCVTFYKPVSMEISIITAHRTQYPPSCVLHSKTFSCRRTSQGYQVLRGLIDIRRTCSSINATRFMRRLDISGRYIVLFRYRFGIHPYLRRCELCFDQLTRTLRGLIDNACHLAHPTFYYGERAHTSDTTVQSFTPFQRAMES